jgi:excinuclease ABC subunit C
VPDARTIVARLPNAPGVYRFVDRQGRVLYVGRAVRLRSRVGSYWGGLAGRKRLRRMVERIARIDALACDSEHEAAWLERNVLERSKPRWNRTSGTEVPVFICLDDQALLPRLCVVHSLKELPAARHFGPYLGGFKVRTAVSALHRALPLAYAGEAISGLGRDIARIRGVAPADRRRLADTICAALNREPAALAAVREALVRQRDSAANILAFELARQLQTEIEALDWVLAEQKVTRAEPCDFDAYGWSSGVLMHFEVRGGRLCDWRARACGEAEGQSLVATTPVAWAGFAQRNAELAALLAG